MLLYKATNRLNGKAYIGITSKKICQRIAGHLWAARKGTRRGPFQAALLKYGRDAFEIVVLAECRDWKALCALEQEAIASHGTRSPNGYNLTLGGEGTLGVTGHRLRLGMKHSAETRARISEVQKGRRLPPAWAAAIGRANRGKKRSAAAREKYRAAKLGPKNPQFGKARPADVRDRIAAGIKGLRRPPEFGAAISARQRGEDNPNTRLTAEQVRAIRAAKSSGRFGKEIAADFGISPSLVSFICNRTRWAHVE